MKKIHIIIILTIIITITSSLFFGKNQNKKTIKQKTTNPNGADVKILKQTTQTNVKVLGKTTENIKQTKKRKDSFQISKLYSLINSYRKDHKLNQLIINQSLETSAKRKIEDMIKNSYFRHKDTNNIESWYLFKAAGYEYKTAGENLSSGINTPWQVFDAWRNSEPHNKQLLNKTYSDMGIAKDCKSYKIAKKSSCIVVLHLGSK